MQMPFKRSITDNNVDHFIALLELAESDGDRSRYQHLLVSEEDRYAQFSLLEEGRDTLDRLVADCTAKIDRQAELLNEVRAYGGDTTQAERLMFNLTFIRETLAHVRSKS